MPGHHCHLLLLRLLPYSRRPIDVPFSSLSSLSSKASNRRRQAFNCNPSPSPRLQSNRCPSSRRHRRFTGPPPSSPKPRKSSFTITESLSSSDDNSSRSAPQVNCKGLCRPNSTSNMQVKIVQPRQATVPNVRRRDRPASRSSLIFRLFLSHSEPDLSDFYSVETVETIVRNYNIKDTEIKHES